MTLATPVAACREVAEADALIRALASLRHWSMAANARAGRRDDLGRRLHTTAARLRERAWADALIAAYRLFEIEALRQAWQESEGAQR